ncbi:MAG: hypothetical protein EPN21_06990 [Methylococcaceae bacterium]|nr:MAG: hypothetical protein EPN21_06990 [Methylococcaceae bacterium]
MVTIVLDTLEFTTRLKAGGFSEQQAETQARVIADLVEKQLATRQEVESREADIKREVHESENRLEIRVRELELKIENTRAELKLDIDIAKAELKRDIEACRADLVKWVVGVVFGVGLLQLSIITALLLRVINKL